jgi:hypothetical protein
VNRRESMAKSLPEVAVPWQASAVHSALESETVHRTFPKTRKNEENLMVPFSLRKLRGKATSAAKYCVFSIWQYVNDAVIM